jgi:hypothetical protein
VSAPLCRGGDGIAQNGTDLVFFDGSGKVIKNPVLADLALELQCIVLRYDDNGKVLINAVDAGYVLELAMSPRLDENDDGVEAAREGLNDRFGTVVGPGEPINIPRTRAPAS